MSKKESLKKHIKEWNQPGSSGFFLWFEFFEPRIKQNNIFKKIVFNDDQKKIITDMLEPDNDGTFLHSLCLLQMPRRHGKSSIMRLIVLWLLSSRPNYEIYMM